jgi:PAS domain S-box-containing protein
LKEFSLTKKYIYEHVGAGAWLLIVLTSSVFITETLVMFFLDALPVMPKILSTLLDATLLSALLFPAFYFLVFSPLLQNIAERKRAEAELRVSAVAFEIKDPILIADANGNIIRANNKFLSFTGYTMEELVGNNPRILQAGHYSKDFYEAMWQQILRKGSWSGTTRIKSKSGNGNLCWLTITAVKNEHQEVTHYVAIYNNG